MTHSKNKLSFGFTLIEVLIALVVAVVGILAMIQLSGVFLKTVAEADQRTVAYAVAEQTIEGLRSFDSLAGSTAGESYFDEIVSSTATTTVSSGQASYTFNIAWTVSDNIVASGAVTPGASGAIYQTLKQVDVVVSWVQPAAGSVALSSYIGGVDPNASALTDISNVGGANPEVNYTPGVAPEVIAVDVADGKLKETTKPLPEVSNKNQSTQVRFETITFTDTDTEIQLIQEDFVTVNCRCVLDTSGGTITAPAYQKFEGINSPLTEVLGGSVSGATGTAATLGGGRVQSDYCNRCCANHHDTNSSTVKYSPHAGDASTGVSSTLSHGVDHPHYKIIDDTTDPITLEEAVHGDEYLEACRFKRINGIYRLVQDWELREVNVFPSAYLTSGAVGSNLPGYVEYIKDAVKHYVFNDDIPVASVAASVVASTAAPTLSPAPSLTLSTTGTDDSLSRAIYLDDILSVEGLAEYLVTLSAASVAEDTWLEFIPFNEVNTSQLSLWESANSNIATVENQAISDNYTRGLISAASTGTTTVAASMAQGNTGILGNTYNVENVYADTSNKITITREWISGPYNPMTVIVSGAAVSPGTYDISVSGDVTQVGGSNLYNFNCTANDGSPTVTTWSGDTYTCAVGPISNGDTPTVQVTVSAKGQNTVCSPTTPILGVHTVVATTDGQTETGKDFVVAKKNNLCP